MRTRKVQPLRNHPCVRFLHPAHLTLPLHASSTPFPRNFYINGQNTTAVGDPFRFFCFAFSKVTTFRTFLTHKSIIVHCSAATGTSNVARYRRRAGAFVGYRGTLPSPDTISLPSSTRERSWQEKPNKTNRFRHLLLNHLPFIPPAGCRCCLLRRPPVALAR